MLPPGCPLRALLLGLGGGTVAHLLARRCTDVVMVGVERNPQVIAIAMAQFGLGALPTSPSSRPTPSHGLQSRRRSEATTTTSSAWTSSRRGGWR